MTDPFSECHPAVGFVFFLAVIGITSFANHPLIGLISLAAGVAYSLISAPGRRKKLLFGILPLMLLTALVNPLFSHEGATILAYFPNGNPLTLESIICGLSSALTLAAVVCWFGAFSRVMTSDKFVWLFGRIIPVLSLLLSMTLRFVPRFTARIKAASDAEKLAGESKGGFRDAVGVLAGSVMWAMDSSLVTADSMKSRGWGLPGRTAYTDYRLGKRDIKMLAWLGFSGIYAASGQLSGGLYWRFFPTIKSVGFSPFTVSFALVFAALALTPAVFDAMEGAKWKSLR